MGSDPKPSATTKLASYLSVLVVLAIVGGAIVGLWPYFAMGSTDYRTRRTADRVLEKESSSSFVTRAAIGGGAGVLVGVLGLGAAELRKRRK